MAESPEPTGPRETSRGVGRVLVAVYAVFALSASARAGVQLATKYHEAPLAYLLSAFAGGVYILATIGLAGRRPAFRTLAWVAVLVEMTGVLVVGTLSVAAPADFPKATVWSGYGAGYGWVPLVLPIFGLLWLRRTSRDTPANSTRD
ncbi:MAG TPA: hypothetical protein VL595_12925 [Pseudonocardia sp.]|nr:hypothetical protein [Pseudonocardia sp.]